MTSYTVDWSIYISMTEQLFYNYLLIGFTVIAVIVFILLFFITAPYGRYTNSGWGISISNRLAWFLMEAPASILFAVYFVISEKTGMIVPIIFFLVWQTHYFHRGLIYPFTLKRKKDMPLVIMFFGATFNIINTYIQGRWVYFLSPEELYTIDWVTDPRFIIGIAIFFIGYSINKHSDGILRSLRKSGDNDYKIPRGGMFKYVTSPNYFGEIIEWIGWAVMTWSLAGVVFVIWTVANLLPRAKSHHEWYKEHFPDYPPERKRIIPFIY
jgi:3-oxo-5-alpha-steroid 4-dehydrogenase 1